MFAKVLVHAKKEMPEFLIISTILWTIHIVPELGRQDYSYLLVACHWIHGADDVYRRLDRQCRNQVRLVSHQAHTAPPRLHPSVVGFLCGARH